MMENFTLNIYRVVWEYASCCEENKDVHDLYISLWYHFWAQFHMRFLKQENYYVRAWMKHHKETHQWWFESFVTNVDGSHRVFWVYDKPVI